MIDYFALALGHGLLVLAFFRLVMRDSLDVDPAISELQAKADLNRPGSKGRRARRANRSAVEQNDGPNDISKDNRAER